ncbi:MAG: sugar phosphate isomerase/epimerase [Spirochaetales bacterium]|nr:sugar phosphate isomerase/epimerase [Spirochaetales bacterium]
MVKSSVITGFLSQTKDRFHEYNKALTLEERFAMVAAMKDIDGVEVVYPYEVEDVATTRGLMEKYHLNWAAVNVNVKAEPEFRNGGLTSNDKAVRNKAVRFIKEAKDFATQVGANKVTCCPLGDGYEFYFQSDYARSWKYLVETLGEAGNHLKEIPLFIEYKPSETRGRCFVNSAAKTLCLLNDIGIGEMGVTIDFGHSMYGGETPAEAVSLVGESPHPMYIHINDNDGRWDWDFFVGSRNFLAYVEFLYYLQEYGYKDYITSDTSPTRWDIKRTFETNARVTNKLWTLLETLDREKFRKMIHGDDYLETWAYIEEKIFKM